MGGGGLLVTLTDKEQPASDTANTASNIAPRNNSDAWAGFTMDLSEPHWRLLELLDELMQLGLNLFGFFGFAALFRLFAKAFPEAVCGQLLLFRRDFA